MDRRFLVYLYVENLGECFKEQSFNFSSNLKCSIIDDKVNKKNLIIEKINNQANLYFSDFNIERINLIIGENGSGKTTILDSLGSTAKFKIGIVKDIDYKKYKWLAIYGIENEPDNYIMEYHKMPILSNIKWNDNIRNYEYKNVNKVSFKKIKKIENEKNYDFEEVIIDNEFLEKKKIVYLYKKNSVNSNEQNIFDIMTMDEIDHNEGYKRVISKEPSTFNMINYINEVLEKDRNVFKGKNLRVIFDVKKDKMFSMFRIYRKSREYKNNLKQIYGFDISDNHIKIPNILNNIDMFKICYLESIVLELINQKKVKNQDFFNNYFDYSEVTNNYIEDRIEFLMNIIKDTKFNKDQEIIFDLIKIVFTFLDGIAFTNFVRKDRISIPIFHKQHYRDDIIEYIENLVFLTNKYNDSNLVFEKSIKEWIPFEIRLSSISSGELQYIKSFSNIYESIKLINSENVVDYLNFIILLDEPDMNFHPEWSRRYISTLNEMLKNFEPKNNNMSFQFIITSHSPFLISDVPKEFILCIQKNGKNTSEVNQAKYGLMSNMYDLIKDSFFMEKPVGELANDFFENIKKDIEYIKINDNNKIINIENIENIEGKISLIDDPIIKNLLENFLEETIREVKKSKDFLL
ncbi:hypothetical protein MKY22_08650 [Exiguobacterium sp. FSL W8-0210]|uniref:AAA family ATPase n=1 Tax=Exiguobacterium sp. FSL W8-0210 TaxID=2921598 RepID=UPI0030F91F03